MYKVIVDFIDLQDHNHSYKKGDTFPRDEAMVLSARYDELASDKNRRGIPLIVEVEDEPKPKKTRSRKTENDE